jgi:hypothetical protein
MAVVASATGVALGATAGTIGAGLLGGAVLGAGAGALYSAVTGDGNILNSALTGGLLGAGVGGLGAALAPAAAGGTAAGGATSALGAASAPSSLAAPTANVLTSVPTAGLTSANTAGLNALASNAGVFAEGSAALPGAGLSVAPETISPSLMAATGAQPVPIPGGPALAKTATDALSTKEVLGYGLAGSAALSLMGGMNQPKLSSTPQGTSPAYIRPYTYAQTRNPNYGQPGQSYYTQGYTAQTPYKAASGGLMGQNGSFLSQDEQAMYPQSQMDKTQYSVSSQMPTSAEVVGSDYDARTNAFTGLPMARFDEGGKVGIPPVPQVAAPLNVAINPATNQNQIVAPVQLPTTQYTPQAVANPGRFQNAYNQYQYESNIQPRVIPYADVINYREKLNQRAADEYLNAPTPAAFRAAPPPPPPPPPPSPEEQAAERAKTIAALPKNQSTFNADAYLAANPDVKAGLGSRGVESAWAHYQNFGQREGRDATFDIIPPTPAPPPYITNPMAAASGLPQYTYNAATKSFGRATPAPSQDPLSGFDPDVLQAMYADYQNRMNSQNSGGAAAGGLMPGALKYASGGATGYNLGSYSDGGRLLKGPGDGMSDHIPASIADKQPARLADGEFVVPADVVSHLGNGSTDAGAKKLYAMMDKVRQARTGHTKQGKQIKAEKYLKA